MIKLFLITTFALLYLQVFSQDSLDINLRRLQVISISYFGETRTHYGLKIGSEYPIWFKDKTKIKKNLKEIHKRKELFLTANIGGYIHKRNHIGLYINSEIGYRKIRKNGFKSEILLGLGYLYTFLQGDTYEVNDDGTVNRIYLAGQSNLMIPFAFSLGYDFNFHYKKPFSLHLKPGFFIQYPYNIAVAVRPTIELGLFYYLNK